MVADTKADWSLIRAQFCAGVPVTRIAEEFGVSRQAVYKRVKRYGWKLGDKFDASSPPPEVPAPVVNSKIQSHLVGSKGIATPEMMQSIVDAVARGLSVSGAAKLAGIHPATVYSWRDKNPSFAMALEKANETLIDEQINSLRSASKTGDWRAGKALLDVFDPRFSARSSARAPAVTVNISAGREDAVTVENPTILDMTAGASDVLTDGPIDK
ncbi:transposase [uncultured Mediterranean phage uvMED]|nr:transposase [uncultured Mediterranean phage uvMED]BAR25225.1 transposase [uncultured Mediterranean phage uvMED]